MKKRIFKKIFAPLLAAVCILALMPVANLEVRADGIEVTVGEESTTAESYNGTGWSWNGDAESGTLSIDGTVSNVFVKSVTNLTITGSGTVTTVSGYGIKTSGCNLTVNGTGNNGLTINSAGKGIWCITQRTNGLQYITPVGGALTLSGKINVTSGSESAIYADDDITVSAGSNITAVCNATDVAYEDLCNGIGSVAGNVTINGGNVSATGYSYGIYAYGRKSGVDDGININGGTVSAAQTKTKGTQSSAIGVAYGKIEISNDITSVTATAPADSEQALQSQDPTYAMGYVELGTELEYKRPTGGYIGGINFGGVRNPDGTVAKLVVIAPIDEETILIPQDAVTSNLWFNGNEQSTLSNFGTMAYDNPTVNHSVWDGFEWTGVTSARNAGTYTAKAHLTGNKTWSDGTTADKSFTWTIHPTTVQEGCFYGFFGTQYYTGSPLTPNLYSSPSVYAYLNTVQKDGAIYYPTDRFNTTDIVDLIQGVDYNITNYTNNVEPGVDTASATFKFNTGNLVHDDIVMTFSIKKRITEATLSATSFTYDGQQHYPMVTSVKCGDELLTTDDYYVSYYYNDTYATSDPTSKADCFISPGTYRMKVTGKSNSLYGDTIEFYYTITSSGSSGSGSSPSSGGSSESGEAQQVNPASIANATVTGVSDKTYTGKAITQKPKVKVSGKTLTLNTDYTLSYKNNTKVGTATMTITGKGNYTGSKKVTFKINKATNPMKLKAKTLSIKAKDVKKKAKTYKISKCITFSQKAQGTVTYAKKSGNGKITVDKKTGKVTVKKGLKKGTYKIKVNVTAAGNSNYKKLTKQVTLTIKVK